MPALKGNSNKNEVFHIRKIDSIYFKTFGPKFDLSKNRSEIIREGGGRGTTDHMTFGENFKVLYIAFFGGQKYGSSIYHWHGSILNTCTLLIITSFGLGASLS
jgi:hypothetical protein